MTQPDLFGTEPSGYPNSPGYKERTTSREAARKMAPRAQTIRDQVLITLQVAWPGGLTTDECATKIGKTPLAVRPRFSELREMKEIVPSLKPNGEAVRRANGSRMSATVWIINRSREIR